MNRLPSAEAPQRPVLWRELAAGLLLFGLYIAVDSLESPDRRVAADRHGHDIFDLEQRLHLDVELALNQWLAPHGVLSTLANYEYAWTYLLSALALLSWIWVRRPDLWRYTRDSFIVLNLLAIGCFALYPTTPPRLLPSLGFTDTVSRDATFGSWGTGLVDTANQLAAMPSLHVGWALWVSVVLARITARRSIQLISGLHVALTVVVVMATGNHFLLDAIAVVIPVMLGVWYAEWRHGEGARGEVVPSCDAFFLHVEGAGAAQHVGGVVIVEPERGDPGIEDVRELVRTGLARHPRFHQRLAPPTRWRRPRWVEDDEVDLAWHVVERRSGDGLAGLHRIIAEFAERPMPRDRPLWRVVWVRDVGPDTSALVLLVHHAIADGIGTVMRSLSLFRPQISLPSAPARGSPGRLQRAAAVTVGLAQLATDGGAARTGSGSGRRTFGVLDVDLATARRVASSHDVRVTDLLVALVADALPVAAPSLAGERELRFSLPMLVPAPDSTSAGNATATVMVDVPVDGRPIADLVAEVARRTARLRRPTRALASRFVMTPGLRVLPEPMVGWFARTVYGSRYFHVVVSNLPGPSQELTFLGDPVDRAYPILPVAPGTSLALGALSWTGVLGLGVAADPAQLDVALLTEHIADALAELDHAPVSNAPADSGVRPLESEEQAST